MWIIESVSDLIVHQNRRRHASNSSSPFVDDDITFMDCLKPFIVVHHDERFYVHGRDDKMMCLWIYSHLIWNLKMEIFMTIWQQGCLWIYGHDQNLLTIFLMSTIKFCHNDIIFIDCLWTFMVVHHDKHFKVCRRDDKMMCLWIYSHLIWNLETEIFITIWQQGCL